MDLNLSASDLAKVLKLSTRRVNQLVKESILKRGTDGKFYIPDAVEDYYAFKHTGEKINYDQEHALLEKAKRETAKIELEQLKGQLLFATDVEAAMATMILNCKGRLMAIPSKCAPKVLGQKNLAVIQDEIKKEVYQALEELRQMPAPRDEDGDTDAADTGIQQADLQ